MADFSKGFWADHWTYLVDMINGWLAVYPDWEERILFDTRIPFFFSPAFVKPRSEKYVLSTTFDGNGKHIRQLNAVVDEDPDKVAYQKKYIDSHTGWYKLDADWQHTSDGRVFRVSPMAKLFLLATIKFATRDPYGMGIEYESDRPGWDDANNGLVGMLGSGLPEAIELNKLLRYVRSTVERYDKDLEIPIEAAEMIDQIMQALEKLLAAESMVLQVDDDNLNAMIGVPSYSFRYWDRVASAREGYREKTKVNFSGNTTLLSSDWIQKITSVWIDEVDKGIARAHDFGTRGYGDNGEFGVTPTYFSYNVLKWTENGLTSSLGHPLVDARKMEVRVYPMFLEGPTRMMKLLDSDDAKELYQKVRASPLRDHGLGMYTISASLQGQSFDLGREMSFAPVSTQSCRQLFR